VSVYLQQLVNLLQLGSIYALLAIGFSIVYGIAGLVNFAHGQIFMVSSYILFFVGTLMYRMTDAIWVVFIAALLGAIGVTAILAYVIEKIAYKPLRNAPKVSVVVSSVGVGLVLEYAVLTFVGAEPQRMPVLIHDSALNIGGTNLSTSNIIIIAVAVAAMVLLNLFIKKSRIGVALRAVSQDETASSFMGIAPNSMVSLAFIIGAAMATIGASLYGVAYPIFGPYIGDSINWWSFTAAVLGGIGSIKGAVLGGFLLAAVNVISPMVLPVSSYRDVVAFAVLILVLLIKPTGLLGKKLVEKV